ncbi:hypothetical protein BaRGS_00040093 [Batillaria attramentaria]|uniref:Ribosomal protein S14 n=1 Tax=Batillaria attramentaria TaxID=370345 RepID=A0ABD0J173_9CAEN
MAKSTRENRQARKRIRREPRLFYRPFANEEIFSRFCFDVFLFQLKARARSFCGKIYREKMMARGREDLPVLFQGRGLSGRSCRGLVGFRLMWGFWEPLVDNDIFLV